LDIRGKGRTREREGKTTGGMRTGEGGDRDRGTAVGRKEWGEGDERGQGWEEGE